MRERDAERIRLTGYVAGALAGMGSLWALLTGYDLLSLVSEMERIRNSVAWPLREALTRRLLWEAGVGNLGSLDGVRGMGLGFVALALALGGGGGWAAKRPSVWMGLGWVAGGGLLLVAVASTDWIAGAFAVATGAALVIGCGALLKDD